MSNIIKDANGQIIYSNEDSLSTRTGVPVDNQFAIVDNQNVLKQIQFQINPQSPGPGVLTLQANIDGDTTVNLTSLGSGNNVQTLHTPSGDAVATTASDTLNLTSGDSSITISASGKTVDLRAAGSGVTSATTPAVNNTIVTYNGTSGTNIHSSGLASVDNSGNISGANLTGTNSGDITLAAVGSAPSANGASLSGQILTLQPANSTNPGLLTTGAQTIAGAKTLTGILDVGTIDHTGTMNIGPTNATTINIGNSGALVNIQGTVITENSTTLNVTNPTIVINTGGGAASAGGSGIQIDENSIVKGSALISTDRNSWELIAPNTAGKAIITPGSGGITLNQSSHNPVTIGTANGLSLSTQVLSLGLASTSTTGALSSTDWNTFNSAAGGGITSLTGGVTATGPGAAAATVVSVGGSTAANVHAAELLANAATNLNTASTIVKRDASGNFTAGTITAALTGTASGNALSTRLISTTAPLTGGGDLSADRTLVIAKATSSVDGYLAATDFTTFSGKQSSTLTSAHLFVGNGSNVATDVAVSGDISLANTGAMTVSTVGSSTASNIHNAELAANAATNVNTVSTIVKRDGSGNFSAGTITATLTGNVTGNVSGTAANITGVLDPSNGGTGKANNTAATLTRVGNFDLSITCSAGSSVTMPTAGTLATQAGTETLTNKTISGASNTITNVSLTTGVTGVLPVANATIATQAISALNVDWSAGNLYTKTLGSNSTLTFSNAISGQVIIIRLTNTASNYTVTWPTIRWAGGSAPTMSPGAVSDVYTILNDGSNFYGSFVQNMS